MPGDYPSLGAELAKPDLAALDDQAASDKLDADVVDLPPVPAPMLESEMLGLLSAASFAAIFDHPRFSDLKRDIDGQDTGAVALWVNAFRMRGTITDAEAAALQSYVARTVVPTTTRARAIPGWELPASAADVARARSL